MKYVLVTGLLVLCAEGCNSPKTSPPTLAARVMHLPSVAPDSSCLESSGGTRVDDGLSDGDVAAIQALIRRTDNLPIMAIEHMPPVSTRENATSASFKARTGIGCHGRLSGHGGVFLVKKAEGVWSITRTGSWES